MASDLTQIMACFCAIFTAGLIIFGIVFGVGSLESLEITEVGLDFDETQVKIDASQLYTGGRHWIGLMHKFLKFETNLQQMSFDGTQYPSISSRSKDGLESTINISFQYKLSIESSNLLQLFYFFPDENYKGAYMRLTRNVIRDTTAKFTAFQQVYNRTLIEQSMRADLTKSLEEYYAVVQNFQLLEIKYPKNFEGAIAQSQQEYFQIEEANYNKSKVQKETEGLIKRAQTESQVILNNAEVEATRIIQGAEGEAAAIKQRIALQTPSFQSLKNDLNLRDKALIAFQWINSMKDLNDKGKELNVMMETPAKIRCMFDPLKTTC